MQFSCPNCQAVITAPPPKPGRFTPKCPKCEQPFVINISIMTVSSSKAAIEKEKSLAAMSHDPDATFATKDSYPRTRVSDDRTQVSKSDEPGFDPERTEFSGDGARRTHHDDVGDPTAMVSNVPGTKKQSLSGGIPHKLGGYEVLKQLGKGGMGAVYLCRQLSLDRSVALKVMNSEWASDPVFVSRFVREAYAAAQLTHHHVVQIYELGRQDDINFFSMEFVEGRSLGELLKKNGKLAPLEAVGYVIQAARGLKFAHDRGMVHRDIKPDNLMLNREGLVKVADLGLVKTRGMNASDDARSDGMSASTGSALSQLPNVTRAGSAMGSPSYIAPEQCRDASTVDGRADIYSLGCTLFALLAGRAPFTGTSAVELISKHLSEPPPPLRQVVAEIPKDLAAIVDRTLAKDPDQRFPSMDALIAELKHWQDRQTNGPAQPTEEQLTQFERLTKQLTTSSKAKLPRLVGVFGPIIGLMAALIAIPISLIASGTILLGTIAAVLAGFITTGIITRSFVLIKAREYLFGARIADWLTVLVVLFSFIVALWFTDFLVYGIVGLVLGCGAGVAYAYLLAKPVHDHESEITEQLEKLTKRWRLAGMDEDAVRQFVIENTGEHWEKVYELLYGYPAKLQARALYAEMVAGKPKHAVWQDVLLTKFEDRIEARRQAKTKKLLQKMEIAKLKAQGVSDAEAKARSEDAADDLIEQVKDIKKANAEHSAKVNIREMMTKYERAKATVRPRKAMIVVVLGKLIRALFDPRLRLVLGVVLILGTLFWFKQNAPDIEANLARQTESIQKPEDVGKASLTAWQTIKPLVLDPAKAKPLSVTWLPQPLAVLFDSINPLIAGILLLLSATTSRSMTMLGVLFGAIVALLGHKLGFAIPELGPLKPAMLSGLAGFVIGIASFILLGRK